MRERMRIPARRDGVCVARGLRRRFRGAARTCVGVRSGLTRWTPAWGRAARTGRLGALCAHQASSQPLGGQLIVRAVTPLVHTQASGAIGQFAEMQEKAKKRNDLARRAKAAGARARDAYDNLQWLDLREPRLHVRLRQRSRGRPGDLGRRRRTRRSAVSARRCADAFEGKL